MIKIYYSHTPFWRAEVLRVSLFIKDIPFEDIRVSREEFVHLIKTGFLPNGKKAPFHQLPVIEAEGKIIGQTGAIARYCGKASNLYADDNLKAAKIDQIIDAATDITNLVSPTIREKNLDKKMEDRKLLVNKLLPRWFRYLENLLSEDESTWFVEKMSIADIAIWRLMGWVKSDSLEYFPKNILSFYPFIEKIYNNINKNEKILAWVKKTYK